MQHVCVSVRLDAYMYMYACAHVRLFIRGDFALLTV